MNKDGELLIPCIYNEADDFKNGYANVDMNDTVKTIDRTGKVVLNLGKRLK